MLPNLRARLIFLLGCTVFAWPQVVADHGLKFTVFVYNDADAPAHWLSAAEQDAGTVFAEAGLQAEWVNCMPGKRAMTSPECGQPPGPAQLVVRLVPRSLTLGDTAFGVAFLSNDGHVRGCLLRPLQEIARRGGPGDFCLTPRSCDDSRDRASVAGVESTLSPGHHASSLAQRSIAKYSRGRIVVYARAGGRNAGPSVVFKQS